MNMLGMNQNIWGLIISYVFVFFMIGMSTLLQKYHILKEEGARKFIHIGVSHWYLLAMIFFDQVWIAIIPPVTFIVLNYISYKQNLFKAMERNGNGNLGTVYFPISLLIITAISFGHILPFENSEHAGAIAILILGYGDGFAAVFGKAFGTKKLFGDKSIVGTLAMFGFSFAVIIPLLILFTSFQNIFLIAGLLAIIAALIEMFSPKGLDNLTVPIGMFIMYSVLYGVFV